MGSFLDARLRDMSNTHMYDQWQAHAASCKHGRSCSDKQGARLPTLVFVANMDFDDLQSSNGAAYLWCPKWQVSRDSTSTARSSLWWGRSAAAALATASGPPEMADVRADMSDWKLPVRASALNRPAEQHSIFHKIAILIFICQVVSSFATFWTAAHDICASF